jgi:O-antigen/teichoic acid export membrane protein
MHTKRNENKVVMMQKRRILINAIMSVSQIVVISGVLFILYKFLLKTIGVEQLGVWSVVLATTSVANIAQLGLSASVVKFVAKYLARGEKEGVAGVIQTSAISIGILIGLVLLIAYPFGNWVLNLVVPTGNSKEAVSILPYALLSLWIMVIATVFQAALDGCQRIDLRSTLLMGGTLFHLVLCFVLVPSYGLMGLAYARVAQSGIVLIANWIIIRRLFSLLPVIPYQWDRKLFREMIGYGLNFQIISISQMLYDPITKALLTKFGGLAMTGFYEMASRMILQLRALLISANQVLVPTIAELQEKDQEIIQKVYKDSYRLLLYISLSFFFVIIVFIPIISQIWIGQFENTFILFAILLAGGWFLNTLTAPAYFANLGRGELRWNTIGHVMIAVLNLVLGWLLGSVYGGIAVVVAWIFSLIAGSVIILVAYHHRHKIPISELFPKENIGLGLASIGGLFISLVLYQLLKNNLSLLVISSIVILVFFAIIGVPIWLHPMQKRLKGWIIKELWKSQTEGIVK